MLLMMHSHYGTWIDPAYLPTDALGSRMGNDPSHYNIFLNANYPKVA